ncbi:MAG: hypothetical protein C0618_03110 [Desulfuromonas sp.]|nr:MAG: hypothetical protein C0618_03110 [Desulfuromonas sp.]
MKNANLKRWRRIQSRFEPGFTRMLLLSVALHLLFPVFYTGMQVFAPVKEKPPVYRVNLVNKPVKKPQSGRPEASSQKVKKPRKLPPKPAPVAKPVTKPVTKPKPKAKVPPKTKPAPKKKVPATAPKKPQPVTEPVINRVEELALQRKIEALRRENEREKRLDALRQQLANDAVKMEPSVAAPVGEVTGKGDEKGVSQASYVKAFITEQWRLSRYQLPRLDLEAVWILVYSAEGRLLLKEVVSASGNKVFDDSLLRAILKSQDLGHDLGEKTEFEVTFNLREMQD